jgi:hypothetical protein
MSRRPDMLLKQRAVFAIALFAASITAAPGTTRAGGPLSSAAIEPMQGVSFDIGTKRAVSYFMSDADACKLTVTLAETARDDSVNGATTLRMTVAVESGKTAHFDTAAGKGLDFKCQPGAKRMSIDVSDLAAY